MLELDYVVELLVVEAYLLREHDVLVVEWCELAGELVCEHGLYAGE